MTRLGNILNALAESASETDSAIAGLKANKVLWSGSKTMSKSHTATLSEAVSAQPHGIVLVWSAYKDGAVKNYNFSHRFIPKAQVAKHAACSVLAGDIGLYQDDHFAKKLALSDTSITGFADNASTYTADIQWNNGDYVLRYVIGV